MLVVSWQGTDADGYEDLIPDEWVFSGHSAPIAVHEIRGPKGGRTFARCSVVAENGVVALNYSGQHAEFNEKQGWYTGTTYIQLNSPDKKVTSVFWQKAKYSTNLRFWWEADTDIGVEEGDLRLVSHVRYERSQKLRQAKIDSVLAKGDRLACEACGFNFEVRYGPELGEGFCEVHHRLPLAEAGKTANKLDDLAILCANCHRMVHRSARKGNEMLTVSALSQLITKQAKASAQLPEQV